MFDDQGTDNNGNRSHCITKDMKQYTLHVHVNTTEATALNDTFGDGDGVLVLDADGWEGHTTSNSSGISS